VKKGILFFTTKPKTKTTTIKKTKTIKTMLWVNAFNILFAFAMRRFNEMHVDESHHIGHSMQVLHHANRILAEEMKIHPRMQPLLASQTLVIFAAAVTHDTLDHKYCKDTSMQETSLHQLHDLLTHNLSMDANDVDATLHIIDGMSFSKCRQVGYPKNLGTYTVAFHVVREADLLAAYDIDRAMLYHLHTQKGSTLAEAYVSAKRVFLDRIAKQYRDGWLQTHYAKRVAPTLHRRSVMRLLHWRRMLRN